MLEQSSTVTWSRARHGTEWSKARHQRGAWLDTDIVEHGSTLMWSKARHGQRLSTWDNTVCTCEWANTP